MFDEIEKFLRQAAEAAAQQQNKPPAEQRRRSSQQPKRDRPQANRPQPQRLAPDIEIIEADVIDDNISPNKRLARDFRSSAAIAEHTRHLGEDVGQSDESMEAHLHNVFDHKLGSLRTQAGNSTDEAATVSYAAMNEMTSAIALLISSRSTMRGAMILGDILRRPEERW